MWNITQVLGLLLVQLLTLDYPLSTLHRGGEASTEYPENDLLRMLRCLYSPRDVAWCVTNGCTSPVCMDQM